MDKRFIGTISDNSSHCQFDKNTLHKTRKRIRSSVYGLPQRSSKDPFLWTSWHFIFLLSSANYTIPPGLSLSCIHHLPKPGQISLYAYLAESFYRWLALMRCFCITQFINVYTAKYETGGRFWPIVHDSMIFSLVLMQLIAVGSFALKKLSPASTWTLPLPVLTLTFNYYCRRRFLPIFTAYSAEVKSLVTRIVLKLLNICFSTDLTCLCL